jgi:hypothetical protein
LKMCIVAYNCNIIIIFCALSVKLMYRHFNKPYVLMLLLFSLFQCASTIATYMIVLVQFDQSDKSQNACIRNVTNWVAWRVKFVFVIWPSKLHNLFSLSSLLLLLILLSLPTRSLLLSARCKWQKFLSQWSTIHVTEEAWWGMSTNLDILSNCMATMSGMVKLNNAQSKR